VENSGCARGNAANGATLSVLPNPYNTFKSQSDKELAAVAEAHRTRCILANLSRNQSHFFTTNFLNQGRSKLLERIDL
jgi:hypothetical protein